MNVKDELQSRINSIRNAINYIERKSANKRHKVIHVRSPTTAPFTERTDMFHKTEKLVVPSQ